MISASSRTTPVPAGEWHMYRRDHQLSGRSPLPGHISRPALLWSFPMGGSENECVPIISERGEMDLLFTFGGCVVRTDGRGATVWKSKSFGINAIGAVEDLDGDSRLEIVCSTGYEVIVLAGESGDLLLRHYVGFPLSAGTQASTLLCHRFDPASRGMHLIVPLMSAKEVLVFDFREGSRKGELARTLWMDDAFHPTVAAADMDGDGVDELVVSKLCGLYVFNVLTGAMVGSVRWTSNGERHRNYGLLQLIDVDGDGAREVVIVAERVARHIAVIDNDGKGHLTPLWDRFIEFIYPEDTTELRHTGNSVEDVDGDAKKELVVSLFNARKDGRWWLEVLDPLTGALEFEMPDRYLWGIQDFDGDGIPELLVSAELSRNPARFSTVEVLRLRGKACETIWSCGHARFAGKGLRPSGWKSNFRPMQFGHDETWSEHTSAGTTLFLFTAIDRDRSIAEVSWNGGSVMLRSTSLGGGGEFVMSALADVDGDGVAECVLSENNGRILVVRPGGEVRASWFAGYRLQLEGFSAARPGPSPVVYRQAGEPLPLIAVADNTNTIHQLAVDRSAGTVIERWQRRGRGWIGYDNAFNSPYVCDADGNGEPALTAVDPDRDDCSELLAFAPDGSVRRRWLFRDVPAPASTRIGMYEWVVVGGKGSETIVASFYASYSMNSEQTVAVDLADQMRWHREQYGEGEWGRGVGPWSAFSVLHPDGGKPQILFLAKDLLCRLDAESGKWIREPWLLWHATNSVMDQPDWEFTPDRRADFGTEKDPFTAYGSPILADVNNDGKTEILVAGCFGGFGVLREDHSILWWRRTPFTDTMLRLPALADVNGGGQLCVGFCRANGVFGCLEASTGRELWSLDLHSTTADIASGDIDGDGKEEFVAGTTDGRLIAIGTDGIGRGQIRWTVDLGYALGNPVIADVDGDGFAEILVVSGEGKLHCIGKEGRA